MKAGALFRHFTLERPSDATGTVVFSTITKVWGSLSGLSGIESPAIQASADHRVSLRFRDDLTVRDRLRLGDRVFNIVSAVDPTGAQREWQLLVREQV